jgi:N-acetylmuramoyl-L-alanine amidase
LKVNQPQFIIVHHTERNNDFPLFVKLRHKYLRGWDDIGYHYLIGNSRPFTKDGEIYIGRPETVPGAHARGYNFNSIGICLIGNFNKTFPSVKQMNALVNIISEIADYYSIVSQNIFGHSELPEVKKKCPGRNINMDEVRLAMSQNLKFVLANRGELCLSGL